MRLVGGGGVGGGEKRLIADSVAFYILKINTKVSIDSVRPFPTLLAFGGRSYSAPRP